MFRDVAVAYDESPEANRALKTAIQLAKTLGGEPLDGQAEVDCLGTR